MSKASVLEVHVGVIKTVHVQVDAVMKLCTRNILFSRSLEVDGIICISEGDDKPEVVVKMHRTIVKPPDTPDAFCQIQEATATQYSHNDVTAPLTTQGNEFAFQNKETENLVSNRKRKQKCEGLHKVKNEHMNYPSCAYNKRKNDNIELTSPEKCLRIKTENPVVETDESIDGGTDVTSSNSNWTPSNASHDQLGYGTTNHSASNINIHKPVNYPTCVYNKIKNDNVELTSQEKCQSIKTEHPVGETDSIGGETDVMNSSSDWTPSNVSHDQVRYGTTNHSTANINITPDKDLVCNICYKTFANAGNLRRHIRSAHLNQSFQCLKCNKSFNYSSNLKRHSKTCQGLNSTTRSKELTNKQGRNTQYDDNTRQYDDNYTENDDNTRQYDDNYTQNDDNIRQYDENYIQNDDNTKHDDNSTQNDDNTRQYDDNYIQNDDNTRQHDDNTRQRDDNSTQNDDNTRQYDENDTQNDGNKTLYNDDITYYDNNTT
ncbi:unnamed protein product [Owenia fusiformis]|uniref:Uncharacterized protein n=1 Tax=Owenia fusiformis TaxID=6347 RepID=A0A8J1TE70_OWEFU|nr:unnamed protein product [Owenia fusiformis]